MKLSLILVCCLGLAFGASIDVDLHDHEAERDDRSIILPGVNRNCAGQWQTAGNPCANNPLNKLNFPHPTDNTKFLQCGTYNRLYIVQCPAGEVYDQATTSCIPNSLTVAPIQNVASSPCTPQNLAAGNYFFSVAGNNREFIMCDQNGNAQILTCPGQLVWDQSRQSCVIQPGTVPSPGMLGPGYSINNGYLPNGNPCPTQALSQQALFFPHPDPTKFIQCDLVGNAYVQTCPSGLVWNQSVETCASQASGSYPSQLVNGGYLVGPNGQITG